jgi:TRAP-type C4-dicarboxylate transport system permease small subunit
MRALMEVHMTNLTDELSGGLSGPLRVILKIMNAMIIAGGCIMALTFLFVVIFRYGFNANLFAYEEWLMTISFWMFFMASAVAASQKAHLNADVLGFLIKNPKLIWWRQVLVETIEIIVVLLVTYWAWLMIAEEIASYPLWQTTNALKIPFFVPRMGIFLGFVFISIFALLHFYLLLSRGPGWQAKVRAAEEAELHAQHEADIARDEQEAQIEAAKAKRKGSAS